MSDSKTQKTPLLQASTIYKTYESGDSMLQVLSGVSLDVFRGEIVSIMGESGSGKSTLLNILGGLDGADSGSVVFDQRLEITAFREDELTEYRNQHVGFVFQMHNLLPDFTAIENVMLPYLAHQFKKKEAQDRAFQLLSDVGLKDRVEHRPNQLSGGELQRVAIARSLINHPQVVFADEPTGNLDEKNTQVVQELLWELRSKYKVSIVMVTHNTDLAKMGDRSFHLEHGHLEAFNK
jgi:lipoprotein-releasing system ATP-binding protein